MSQAVAESEVLIVVHSVVIPGVGPVEVGEQLPEAVTEQQRQYLIDYDFVRTQESIVNEADQSAEAEAQAKADADREEAEKAEALKAEQEKKAQLLAESKKAHAARQEKKK